MRPWWKKPQELFTIQTDDVGNREPAPRVRERTRFFFLSFFTLCMSGCKILHMCHFSIGGKKKKNLIACFTIVIVHFYVLLTPFLICHLLTAHHYDLSLVRCELDAPLLTFIWALSIKERGTDAWYAVILWTTPLSVKAEGISSQQEVDSSSPCNDA